jgi:hypothetical protein
VARLLPPESSAIDLVSREFGISVATLERWRGMPWPTHPATGAPRWTPAARLQAVIVTAAMDEATRVSSRLSRYTLSAFDFERRGDMAGSLFRSILFAVTTSEPALGRGGPAAEPAVINCETILSARSFRCNAVT